MRSMRLVLLALFSSALLACGGATPSPDGGSTPVDAGTSGTNDAGTNDLFAGTWRLKGPIGAGEFIFPLKVVRASDGNYRGEYAGCVMPLRVATATTLTGLATTCTVTAAQLQDSTYGGSAPGFGNPVTLTFEAGTQVSVVADVMSVTGAFFNAQNSRVQFTLTGTKQ